MQVEKNFLPLLENYWVVPWGIYEVRGDYFVESSEENRRNHWNNALSVRTEKRLGEHPVCN